MPIDSNKKNYSICTQHTNDEFNERLREKLEEKEH